MKIHTPSHKRKPMSLRWWAWCFVYCILLAGCSTDNEQDEADFVAADATYTHLAEYMYATTILMHTPGNENQGSYGLHKQFDVEGMKEEHLAFIHALQKNGIEVHEVIDLLRNAPMSRLQTIAKSISSEDISQMDKELLIRHILDTPPMKGLYFTRDQSITTPRGHVMGKMRLVHRKHEPALIALCYEQLGEKIAYTIEGNNAYLEGGDYLPFGTLSFIGEGLRTNRAAIEELLQADAIGHDTLVVVKDALFNTSQMHLDTYFNIIDSNLVTLPSTRMNAQAGESNHVAIDIYTRAPGRLKYKQTTTNGSLVKFLQDRHIQIIPLCDEDEQHFGSNYLCIAPRHIMVTDGVSEDFKKKMEHYKVKVEYIKLNELTEGNGCAHCMTQVLLRQP